MFVPGMAHSSWNIALSCKMQGSFELGYGGMKLNIANKAQKSDHLQYVTVQFSGSMSENCCLEMGGSTPMRLWFNTPIPFSEHPNFLLHGYSSHSSPAPGSPQRILQHSELKSLRIWMFGRQPLMRHKNGLPDGLNEDGQQASQTRCQGPVE